MARSDKKKTASSSTSTVAPKEPEREVSRPVGETDMLVGGILCALGIVVSAVTYSRVSSSGGTYVIALGPMVCGAIWFFRGFMRLRRAGLRDPRPFIYGGLDILLVGILCYMVVKVVPNRLPSAAVHLWSLPTAMMAMAAGTLIRTPLGRKIAIVAGSVVLLSVILMIARIIVSAAFLSGVYGAFGRAAAATALTGIALIVEIVGLLPIVQVKYLMSRAGKRAYGVPA